MQKELYLYSPIYDFVAETLVSQMEEFKDSEIVLRVNTPGGSVFANHGICAKMSELGNVHIKVDGAAMSSGAILLPYAKFVECLDVSTFLLHRADMYVESEADKAFLARINKDLKTKLLLKVDADIFKEVTGVSIDEMFNSEKRIDVILDAKQAKKIGLVNKVNKLTPAEVEAFNNKMFAIAAIVNPIADQSTKPKTMNVEKLKAEHPEVVAQVLAMGVAKEKDRVEACLAFIEIDAAGVKAAIESGKDLSAKQMAEFAVKALNKESLEAIKKDSAPGVATKEPEAKTEKENELEAFKAAFKKDLNLK